MIKVIDNQGCGFLEDDTFKNKSELRNRMLSFAKQESLADETDLRELTLNDLLDIWGLDIKMDCMRCGSFNTGRIWNREDDRFDTECLEKDCGHITHEDK